MVALQSPSEGTVLPLGDYVSFPLSNLTGSDNPRQEPENLVALGYTLIDPANPERSLLHMALSDDPDMYGEFVRLIEEHENDPSDFLKDTGVPEKIDLFARRSIVSLARSLKNYQIEPVGVRMVGKSQNGVLVYGQRRVIGILYNHAASKVAGGRVSPATVKAEIINATKESAWQMAVAENFGRKDFTPLQLGAVFWEMAQKFNPSTGKRYTLKEIAKITGEKYQIVRNRHALMRPRTPDKYDTEGNLVRPGKGLTDADREALASGRKTLTWATRRALGEVHFGAHDGPAGKRRRLLPLAEIHKKFDLTPANNLERRRTLAEVMGLSLDEAEQQSEGRAVAQDLKDMKTTAKLVKAAK
jgi:hypothetical protein